MLKHNVKFNIKSDYLILNSKKTSIMSDERYHSFLINAKKNLRNYIDHIEQNEKLYEELNENKISLEEYHSKIFNGSTGLELQLCDRKYIRQIFELNNYVFTTGSTTNPSKWHQAMWVEGWMHIKYFKKELINYVEENDMLCVISSEDYCCHNNKQENEKEGKIIYSHDISNKYYKQVCENICTSQFFFKDYKLNRSHKFTQKMISSIQPYLDFCEDFRNKVIKLSFKEAFEQLTEKDFNVLDEITKILSPLKIPMWKICTANGCAGSDFCCEVKDLIKEKDILYFLIVDLSRMDYRMLYEDLIEIFKN